MIFELSFLRFEGWFYNFSFDAVSQEKKPVWEISKTFREILTSHDKEPRDCVLPTRPHTRRGSVQRPSSRTAFGPTVTSRQAIQVFADHCWQTTTTMIKVLGLIVLSLAALKPIHAASYSLNQFILIFQKTVCLWRRVQLQGCIPKF